MVSAIPDLVITTLSLLGGAGIVFGFFVSSQRRLRQRLVLGLGVVDVIAAGVVLVGSAIALADGPLDPNSAGCRASAFIYQAAVVVSAAWTLAIAIVTYVTLVHPMSRLAYSLEHQFANIVIWVLVWLVGIIPAAFGTAFFPLTTYGGLCYYKSDTLAYKTMIFVPRAATLLTVIILYIRLFWFFRKRDVAMLDTSGGVATLSDTGKLTSHAAPVVRRVVASDWKPPPHSLTPPTPSDDDEERLSEGIAFPPTSPFAKQIDSTRSVIVALPHHTSSFDVSESDRRHSFDVDFARSQQKKMSVVAEHQAFVERYRVDQPAAPVEKRLTARQINHRTSILMLLYPLAYLVLFSVSVGRFGVQLATNKPLHPTLALVAKWLVYSQGFVDGCLFALIDWLFRRINRNRV